MLCVVFTSLIFLLVLFVFDKKELISFHFDSPSMTAYKVRGQRSRRILTGPGRWHYIPRAAQMSTPFLGWLSGAEPSGRSVLAFPFFFALITSSCFGLRLVCWGPPTGKENMPSSSCCVQGPSWCHSAPSCLTVTTALFLLSEMLVFN